MDRNSDVTIEGEKQGEFMKQDGLSYEWGQVAELRERFGITSPEQVARALRISESRAVELLRYEG